MIYIVDNIGVVASSNLMGNMRVVRSVSEVTDDATHLVYVSSADDDLSIVRALGVLGKSVKCVFYYDKTESSVFKFMVFSGAGADVYDDRAYFEDIDTLAFLCSEHGATGMAMQDGANALQVVEKGVHALSVASEAEVNRMLASGVWIDSMKVAISELSSTIEYATSVGNYALEVFSEAFDLVGKLEETHESTAKEIEVLKEMIKKLKETTSTPSAVPTVSANNAVSHGVYNLPMLSGNAKVVYIKCHGDVPYLLSFLWAFVKYTKTNNGGMRCALLLVDNKTTYSLERYSNFVRLAMDSLSVVNLNDCDMMRAYEPVRPVWDKFFSKRSVTHFIVVDRTMTSGDLLTGSMIKFEATMSRRFSNTNNIPRERLISAMWGYPDSLVLKPIKGYSTLSSEVDRLSAYIASTRSELDLFFNRIKAASI